jgi:hypothetical protein
LNNNNTSTHANTPDLYLGVELETGPEIGMNPPQYPPREDDRERREEVSEEMVMAGDGPDRRGSGGDQSHPL